MHGGGGAGVEPALAAGTGRGCRPLRRVAAEREHNILDGTVDILSETQPRAPWIGAPGWRSVKAWRAVSVWESERVLLVEFDGPRRHTLMAAINEVGGCLVETLAVVEAGAAASWPQRRESDGVPMPLTAQPVEDVLADLGRGFGDMGCCGCERPRSYRYSCPL